VELSKLVLCSSLLVKYPVWGLSKDVNMCISLYIGSYREASRYFEAASECFVPMLVIVLFMD
jgi:hypothetical protein